MDTINDKCFYCSHAYMNCYQSCHDSPDYKDSTVLLSIETEQTVEGGGEE